MLTLFTCPKPFTEPHIAVIQRNAITSWTFLQPRPEIILVGDEKGIAEICQELGLLHIPKISKNEFGTPLLNDIFGKAQELASRDLLCYINADIILTSDFLNAVMQAETIRSSFLLSGGNWGLRVTQPLDFNKKDWEPQILSEIKRNGEFRFLGNDYFLFRKGLYQKIPAFAIGRFWFDAWLMHYARLSGAILIDASRVVTAIHQNHDYPGSLKISKSIWVNEEVQRNSKLADRFNPLFLYEATHLLTHSGLRRIWWRKPVFLMRSKFEEIFIYRLGSLRQRLGITRVNIWGR